MEKSEEKLYEGGRGEINESISDVTLIVQILIQN